MSGPTPTITDDPRCCCSVSEHPAAPPHGDDAFGADDAANVHHERVTSPGTKIGNARRPGEFSTAHHPAHTVVEGSVDRCGGGAEMACERIRVRWTRDEVVEGGGGTGEAHRPNRCGPR